VFALLEYWGMGYADAMAIPYSRRKRLLREKEEMERRRMAQREASTARVRRRR
jgi:hypothetical protein